MVFVHAGLRPGTAGRFVNRPYKITLCPLWRGNIAATKKNDQPKPPGGERRGRWSGGVASLNHRLMAMKPSGSGMGAEGKV